MLLLIATDGEPFTKDYKHERGYDSVKIFKNVLEKERDPHKIFVGILKCTNNDKETGYLDKMDKKAVNLDVIDDYWSETVEADIGFETVEADIGSGSEADIGSGSEADTDSVENMGSEEEVGTDCSYLDCFCSFSVCMIIYGTFNK